MLWQQQKETKQQRKMRKVKQIQLLKLTLIAKSAVDSRGRALFVIVRMEREWNTEGGNRKMELVQWVNNKNGTEKILITDNMKNINTALRQICHDGTDIYHIRVVKLTDLAREIIIRDFAKQGEIKRVQMETEDTCVFLVDELLRKQAKTASFFIPQESMCEETAREVLHTMNQIRMGAVTDAYKDSTDKKIVQIKQMIQDYENLLEDKGIYDHCRLLKDAIQIMMQADYEKQPVKTACRFFQKPTALEKAFLSAYTDNYEELSVSLEQKATYHFFKTYGIVNEINYVIRDIKDQKIPFGKVNLLYSSLEYEPFIKGMLSEQQIPHSFLSRYSAETLPSIRLILDLLNWAEGGYVYEQLEPVVRNPVFRIKGTAERTEEIEETEEEIEESEKKSKKAVFIDAVSAFQKGIAAGIGWGVSRYESEENWKIAKERTGKEYAPEFIACLKELAGIFSKCQGEDISVASLFSELLEFIKKYQRKHEAWKVEKGILDEALDCFQTLGRELPLEEAIVFLKDYFEQAVYQEEERTDAVHVIYFQGMQVMERQYQYVIGLSDKHFGVNMAESPVLSDQELETYLDARQGEVQLAKNRGANRREDYRNSFATAAAGTDIFLGYSFYDTLRLEELSPSDFYLTMLEENETLEKDVEIIGQYDGILETNIEITPEQVWKESNQEAEEQNKTEQNELECSFSPTEMYTLLACPLQYYYHYIRKLSKIEYAKKDSGKWLPANEKGNLVHEVLQEYVTEEFVGKEEAGPDINMELWETVWDKNIEKMKWLCACDSEQVQDSEGKEIKAAVEAYLQKMHQEFSKQDNSWKVLYCEKKIESGQIFEQKKLGGKTIKLGLYGNIDRIDGYQDETGLWHIRIIDYKTGTLKHMEEKIAHQQTIQHLMYTLIVNNNSNIIMNRECKVDQFVYEFVLESEPEKQELILFGDTLTKWDSTVDEKLEKVLVQKKYEGTGKCEYCSYKEICGKNTLKVCD